MLVPVVYNSVMLAEMVILGLLARLLYKRQLPELNLTGQHIHTQVCVIGDVYSEKQQHEQIEKEKKEKDSGVVNLAFQNNNNDP